MSLSDSLPKLFDSKAAAARVYPEWEAAGRFAGDASAPGPAFCIVIPPPNVTGSLHMGHALNNTLQDVLVRYKRMDGHAALWIPGTDHAGIATQWVVERELRKLGLDRRGMGREAFVEKVWQWKEESGGTITRQLRSLGVSCDWGRERFTMDAGLSRAVREAFVRLYEEGLVYRAERLINWDPVSQTALSDLEVESHETVTDLWSFAYPLSDGSGEIVVATTRPETMLGDTAVAVHPDDPRYKALIGHTVRHPILGREIPIVGDAILVDPQFGTGAVKVTPAHDFNDFEVGKRHGLELIGILNPDGTLNRMGGPYEGLTVADARAAVKERIAALGLDRGSQPHTLPLPRSQRSGAVVEPMISTQWFVKMGPLAAPALAAVENGFTRFVPSSWENTYFAWLRNIKDWCISRQLWWGHRIPAWYCAAEHVTVSREDPTACATCGATDLRQDDDVLDTWFSSSLWPFSTLGWPDRTPELQKFYPTAVLVTAFDIIFFWVARMMFMGLHTMGSVPFRDVYIHALIRDEQGQKMSKTKGNVVDPLGSVDRLGPDAFRMTLVALAAQGRDILWNDQRADGYVKFTNKVWQAFRFAAMHLDAYDPAAPREPSAYDHWIEARLGAAVGRVRTAFDGYRFNDAAAEIYAFTWDELCDWYIELSKGTLYDESAPDAAKQAARHTLVSVFHALVRLFHPIMPFLSEEIWRHLPGTTGTVMQAPFPRREDFPDDPQSLAEVAALQSAIVAVRQIRADMGLSPKVGLALRAQDVSLFQRHVRALRGLANVDRIEQGGRTSVCATAVVGGREVYVPLDGVIDVSAERARLDKEIGKADKDLGSLEQRLGNAKFVESAPPDVVEEFRGKLALARDKRERLVRARTDLGA